MYQSFNSEPNFDSFTVVNQFVDSRWERQKGSRDVTDVLRVAASSSLQLPRLHEFDGHEREQCKHGQRTDSGDPDHLRASHHPQAAPANTYVTCFGVGVYLILYLRVHVVCRGTGNV